MARKTLNRSFTDLPGGAVEIGPTDQRHTIDIAAVGPLVTVVHDADAGDSVKAFRTMVRKSVQRGLDRPDYPEVIRYTLVYSDGSSLPIVVRWGESIEARTRRTFEMESRWLGDLAWATIEDFQDYDYESDTRHVRYRMYWPNPFPEKRIDSLVVSPPESPGTRVRVYEVSVGSAGAGAGAAPAPGPAAGAVSSTEGMRSGLPSGGGVFYVAPDGDDGADGSFENPWATPVKGVSALSAGDTLYLRGGVYRPVAPIVPRNDGHDGAWITICGYPGESAVIEGHDIHIQPGRDEFLIEKGETIGVAPTGTGVVHIYDGAYICVKNLTIRDAPYSAIGIDARPFWTHDHEPTRFSGSHHIDILYNRIERTVNAGIGAYGEEVGEDDRPGRAPARRDQVLHPHTYTVGEGTSIDAVRVVGNQLLNTWDSNWTLSTTDPGPQASLRKAHRERDRFGDECLDFQRVHHFEVAYNEIGWSGKEGIDLMNGTAHGRAHHNYVHHNFVHEWFPGGKIGIYLDPRLGGSEIEVDHNVVEGAGTGIRICNESGAPYHHYRIHHNLVIHNRHIGIDVRGKGTFGEGLAHHIEITNNTAYRNGLHTPYGAAGGGCGISIRGGRGLSDVVVRNNISAHNESRQYALQRGVDRVAHRIVMDYNLTWPAELNLSTERPTGDHAVIGDLPIVADPGFLDKDSYNFGLRKLSPALDSGHPELSDDDGTRSDLGAFPRPNRMPVIPYVEQSPPVDARLSGWDDIPPCFCEHAADPAVLRLCWNETGLYGAVVCRESDGGAPTDWLYRVQAVLIALQVDGRSERAQNNGTFRWVLSLDDEDRVTIDQNRPRGVARGHHFWDANEEPLEQDLIREHPPGGFRASGRRTRNGYELSFFFPAESLAPAKLEAGLELPAHFCVTNATSRVFEYSERAEPAIERIWLSPTRWSKVRFGRE